LNHDLQPMYIFINHSKLHKFANFVLQQSSTIECIGDKSGNFVKICNKRYVTKG